MGGSFAKRSSRARGGGPPSAAALLRSLERFGTEQNRKIYRRHGARDPLFGVSFGNLRKLARGEPAQAAAEELWATGNADARYLATMLADPEAMSSRALDTWARDLDHYVLSDLFAGLAARSPHARARIDAWIQAKGEWIASAGWACLAAKAMREGGEPEAYFESFIPKIERGIQSAKNRVRHEMNGALIAIGTRTDAAARRATAAAERIGRVEVDHGETGCKTPDAAPYIEKARAHRKRKQERARKRG